MDEPTFDILLDGDLIKVFEAECFAEESFDQAADSASQLMSVPTQQLVKCDGKGKCYSSLLGHFHQLSGV